MIRRRLIKGIGAGAVDKMVILGIQLILIPFLTIHWGSEVYGLWLMLSAVPALLAFSDLGLATAAGTSMAMDVAAGRRKEAAKTYASTLRAMLIFGAVLVGLAAIIALVLPDHWIGTRPGYSSFDVRLSVVLLALYGVACLQNSISFAGLRSDGQLHIGTLMHTAIYSVEHLALIVVVFLGGGPVAAAVALATGRIFGSVVQNIELRRRLPWLADLRGHANWRRIAELAGPASAAMAVPAAQMLLSQGATVTLGIAAGASAVPIFTAARTLSRVGLQATQLVSMSVMPEFSAAAGRNLAVLKANLFVLLVSVSLVLAVPFCILLAVWGTEAVILWTNGLLDPPVEMMRVMAAGLLLTAVWMPVSNLLVALNIQSVFSYYYLGLAAIAIPFELWLARAHGLTGSALALLVVDAIMTAIILLNLPRIGISIHDARGGFSFLRQRVLGILPFNRA